MDAVGKEWQAWKAYEQLIRGNDPFDVIASWEDMDEDGNSWLPETASVEEKRLAFYVWADAFHNLTDEQANRAAERRREEKRDGNLFTNPSLQWLLR